MRWARERSENPVVYTNRHQAPHTPAKGKLIEHATPPLSQAMAEILDNFAGDAFTTNQLVAALVSQTQSRKDHEFLVSIATTYCAERGFGVIRENSGKTQKMVINGKRTRGYWLRTDRHPLAEMQLWRSPQINAEIDRNNTSTLPGGPPITPPAPTKPSGGAGRNPMNTRSKTR